jgi:poly-gamma-glutamate synthesis protein (capsule biosynthesis protein)
MTRAVRGLLFLLVLLQASWAMAATPQYRLVFAGDILLAREVAHEIATRHGASPWVDMGKILEPADLVMGNLEGTVGEPETCAAPVELCFADDPRLLRLAKQAGFTALGIANNHSGDLGQMGRHATRMALASSGLTPIGSPESPAFIRLGNRTVAIVAISLVPARDGVVDAVPSWQVAQKLRLARAVADWVIVFVHWGKELADWVVPEQESQATWLVGHGADVIIGAHPHTVQPPACVDGRPVFYSLGNHVFDQKYAATKRGLIAECRIAGDSLTCGARATETPMGSSFPRPAGRLASPDLAHCSVEASVPLTVGAQTIRAWTFPGQITADDRIVLEGKSSLGIWRTEPGALVSAAVGSLVPGGPPMLVTLEQHPSSMDSEDGPRPYVYDVTPHGLIARWRGSALAWPLLDVVLIEDKHGQAYLCALHRGDSFIMLDPARPSKPRIQLYRWNGFGFSGVSDMELTERCGAQYADALSP